jgi:hypothetical protein
MIVETGGTCPHGTYVGNPVDGYDYDCERDFPFEHSTLCEDCKYGPFGRDVYQIGILKRTWLRLKRFFRKE